MGQSQKERNQEKNSEQNRFTPTPDQLEQMFKDLKKHKSKKKSPKYIYIPENGGWTSVY